MTFIARNAYRNVIALKYVYTDRSVVWMWLSNILIIDRFSTWYTHQNRISIHKKRGNERTIRNSCKCLTHSLPLITATNYVNIIKIFCSNFTDISNHSIIYINFGTNKVTNYDQTASYVWYDLLGIRLAQPISNDWGMIPISFAANLGSVGCLSLGATMVSIIEVIYFFSGKLGSFWIRKHFQNVDKNRSKLDYVN